MGLRAAAGSRADREVYRRACERAVDLLADTDNPETAALLIQTCIRLPGSLQLEDYTLLEDLADRVVARLPDRGQRLATQGMLLYRTGRFAEAVGRLEDALKALEGESQIDSSLVLAMCRQRLDRPNEAGTALQQTRQRAESARASPPRGPGGGTLLSWPQRLGHEVLLREAADLIRSK